MKETLWSNQACFGYMILAAEAAGLDQETIQEMVKKMHRIHDEVSVSEAAQAYRGSDY